MQYPVGMKFNPETARNEMQNFWDVLFSPVAVHKFLHTISSGYVTAAIFILGISAWFLLKKRETGMARKSILVAAIFGLITSLFLAITGDGSAYTIAQTQPMKLAAMEGLYKGQKANGLVLFGIPQPGKKAGDGKNNFAVKVEIPGLLSILGYRNVDAFVPGVEDILYGGYKPEFQNVPPAEKEIALPVSEKIIRGKLAITAFGDFKKAKKVGDEVAAAKADSTMKANFAYFGYGYLQSPEEAVPNVALTFYSFRTMLIFGFYFILLFIAVLYFHSQNQLQDKRWLQYVMLWTIPLVYLAGQAGWIVAETGRQPWVIQDLLPTRAAVSMIETTSIQITFWLFAVLFTALLIAELMIMTRQIKLGPKDGGTK
jgi:cytochrome d ubiquinol oxidase subunit I